MVQHVDAQFLGWSTLFQEPNGWLIWRGATSSNLLNCLGPMVVSCASFVVVGSWFSWVSQITNLLRRLWPLSRTPIFPHELLQRLFGMENPWLGMTTQKSCEKMKPSLYTIGTVKSVHLNIYIHIYIYLPLLRHFRCFNKNPGAPSGSSGSYRRCLRRFLLREDCCTLWDGGNHQPESKRTNMNIMNKLHYKDV